MARSLPDLHDQLWHDLLLKRWRRLCVYTGLCDDEDECFYRVYDAYANPGRHYHGIAHLQQVLVEIDVLLARIRRLADAQTMAALRSCEAALYWAAWFHDVVYEAGGAENESESAALARELLFLMGADGELIAEADRLIVCTCSHTCEREDIAGMILCDADLANLALAPDLYDERNADLRQEYKRFSDGEWRLGRSVFLKTFLQREKIFQLKGQRLPEQRAKENMQRELGMLSPPK